MTPESIQAMIDRAIQRNSTHTQEDASQNSGEGPKRHVQPSLKVKGNDVGGYTQRFRELALMCTKFLFDETENVDKYISELPDNIHGNVMSARPKTLDFAIELANDLMDQKLRTYAERQAENKRKLDNNNQDQQQLLKKQNVVQAYAVGSGNKKAYGGSKPLCPKSNYHHDGGGETNQDLDNTEEDINA
nr:hypothetical protein [Tanacetum cinerariifolium]